MTAYPPPPLQAEESDSDEMQHDFGCDEVGLL